VIRGRPSAAVALVMFVVGAAACSSSGHPAASPPASTSSAPTSSTSTGAVFAVGERNAVFVDSHRPTAANGTAAALPSRTLPTVIFYPALGHGATAKNAAPDTKHGPYPLIVFAHGLGSSGLEYRDLLEAWASSGFVVAAPKFPLTSSDTAGAPDPGDYVNQPADMSFVIGEMLRAATVSTGTFSGLIDPRAVGAAGHSLGGITTLGLAVNTCCIDSHVKAAIVMSGDSVTFPSGIFAYGQAPPLLFVHGTSDPLVPYESSVDAFNLAHGPKGLVTIEGGDHSSTVSSSGRAFPSVVRATTDFFDAYLKGDPAAANDIEADASGGVARVVFDAQPGSETTVPTTPTTPPRALRATASSTTGLAGGQPVTVNWSGYTPGKTVNVVQCSQRNSTDASTCDLKHGALLQPDTTGSGSASVTVVSGAVGSGTCDATHPDCVIVVNDGGSLVPTASVRIPIAFAP
jgi:fermentation-respiration switch protein FrsA (DUF1100 family)